MSTSDPALEQTQHHCTKQRKPRQSRTTKSKFTCETCVMTFANRSNLNRHIRHSHQIVSESGGLRNLHIYKCIPCNFSSYQKSNYRSHRVSLKCLRRHDRMHKTTRTPVHNESELNWESDTEPTSSIVNSYDPADDDCSIPKNESSLHNALRRMLKHICEYCGKNLWYRRNMIRHLKHYHPQMNDNQSNQIHNDESVTS